MKNEETLFLFAKAIKSLIKKQPLDKITVTDIVSTAGKTRQTFSNILCFVFYYRFSDFFFESPYFFLEMHFLYSLLKIKFRQVIVICSLTN